MLFIEKIRELIKDPEIEIDDLRKHIWGAINDITDAGIDDVTGMTDSDIMKLYARSMKVRRELHKILPDSHDGLILTIAGFPKLTTIANDLNAIKNMKERQEIIDIPKYFTKEIIKDRIQSRNKNEYATFEAMIDLMVMLMLRGVEVSKINIVHDDETGEYFATNISKTRDDDTPRRIYCIYNMWDFALPMLSIIQKAIADKELMNPSYEGPGRVAIKNFCTIKDINPPVKLSDLREIGALLFARDTSNPSLKKINKRKTKALRHKSKATQIYYNKFK